MSDQQNNDAGGRKHRHDWRPVWVTIGGWIIYECPCGERGI